LTRTNATSRKRPGGERFLTSDLHPAGSPGRGNNLALIAFAVGLSPRRHGRACPRYPRQQRFKTGPTWGGPQQSFAGAKLSPLPRSRTFDAPNHVDSRDKPGHDALKLVRRSPHNPDSDDQQLTRQEPDVTFSSDDKSQRRVNQ
jgi:hypothetical protein